jgi:hypothetical protein
MLMMLIYWEEVYILLVASKKIGLEVYDDKTRYVHGYVSRLDCRATSLYGD